jgi:hypothetical protein
LKRPIFTAIAILCLALDIGANSTIFTWVNVILMQGMSRGTGDQPERIYGMVVSGNYFEVLGVQALLGRGFLSEEDKTPGPHPVAVIGYGLWQRRFGGAPDVTGQTATLNNQRFTIISVNLRRSRVLRPGWLSISGLR